MQKGTDAKGDPGNFYSAYRWKIGDIDYGKGIITTNYYAYTVRNISTTFIYVFDFF